MSQNNRRTATYQGARTCLAFPACTVCRLAVLSSCCQGSVLFKCELCLLITKWNAGRTSSYPILSYFTGFLYNKDIFPESIAVAGNYNRPVHGGGCKTETTFLDLIFWFKPALYDKKKSNFIMLSSRMAAILNQIYRSAR